MYGGGRFQSKLVWLRKAETGRNRPDSGEFDPATPTEDVWNATRFLDHSTVIQVAGASHSPFYTDDCTRGIAHAFLSAPDSVPDTRCVGKRVPATFALSGMDEFLKSLEAEN